MQEAQPIHDTASPRLLRVYSIYRLCLAALLLWLTRLDIAPAYLGGTNPQLFSVIVHAYMMATLISLPIFHLRRWQRNETLLFAALLIDVTAINIMLYASDGLSGSVGYLLMVTVAASATFLSTRLALAMAAIASFIPVSLSLSEFFLRNADEYGVVRSGVFGILLFATALLFIFLTKRLSAVQALVKSESQLTARLQHLNSLVINKMLTGIIVFDRDYRIEQLNERATMLLGTIDGKTLLARNDSLADIPGLIALYLNWKSHPQRQLPTYHAPNSNIPLQLSFSEIRNDDVLDTILFLEDARSLSQHAQQLKNQSLGQLTSNIAHEIRNPLGAISHAAQLLDESVSRPEDRQLVDVVLRHSKRMDRLVNDILQLARQRTPEIEITNIYNNCLLSREQITESGQFNHAQIEIDDSMAAISVPFDGSQLQQVLINLLNNALRHSEKHTGVPWARIEFDFHPDMALAMLRIFDRGPGVSKENLSKLFEPFFTTEHQGTGLGLYIARELCEINFATLSYVYGTSSDGYFQIVFSDPAKQLPRNADSGKNSSDC